MGMKKETKSKQEKALVLLSGGLDSRLACKIMQNTIGKKNVEAIYFLLPFGSGCCSDQYCVFRFCQKQGIRLHIFDLTKGKLFKEYLGVIKKPKHSRGKALNPCMDCHAFMLKKAKAFSKKRKIKIIVTGEVLGERPLSQTKKALDIVDKEANLQNKVLRPLSAKCLPKTDYETKNLVDRDKLYDICGRRRNIQFKLAKQFSIDFPTPGGGCLLCEREYCKKLKPLLNKKNLLYREIQLLSIGRHFFESKIILGKNKQENLFLEKQKNIKIIPKQPGPTALISLDKKDNEKDFITETKKLMQKYSKHKIKDFKIKRD